MLLITRACADLQSDCKLAFPNGYDYCGCLVASDCKIPTHTCLSGKCRTCGEGVSDNKPCHNGLTCDKQTGRCQ